MVARETLTEVLLPRAADRVDQLGVALGVAVVRVTGLRVAKGGIDDALVGGEIGVADAQVDDDSLYLASASVSSDSPAPLL